MAQNHIFSYHMVPGKAALPISPYLFLLAAQLFSTFITESNIQGNHLLGRHKLKFF